MKWPWEKASPKKLYAIKGEAVTCASCGSQVGHFTRDIYCGDPITSDSFMLRNGVYAVQGGPLPICPNCNGEAFRDSGSVAHFVDGWRYSGGWGGNGQ